MERDFILKQYEMMGQELLEIHARTDKLEQFFVAVIGAIYAFGFQKHTGLNDYIFFIPSAISLFVVVRLELLSRVRSILRMKLIEFEQSLGGKEVVGQFAHSQKIFYGNEPASDREGFKFSKLFSVRVSDRASLWKISFWLTFAAAVWANGWVQIIVSALCVIQPDHL
ncbi:hypothetical protein K3X48_08265 [Aliiroseovarius crassostreae]|uniref:Uncharacterized protein n=1 Tax=Aliiroseovarius crassostreae TaxID=154981 RepID=A0A9Q9H645_9RHOB|nr:hypothetical protein [Aliiroseovarius crassostreae]UWP94253.1 hypothetical protein K3X48_08265 [Aliiroseovarius crassostreae]